MIDWRGNPLSSQREFRSSAWEAVDHDLSSALNRNLSAPLPRSAEYILMIFLLVSRKSSSVCHKLLEGLAKRAEVRPFGFHSLRRYVATYLSDKEKVATKTIQKILGHSSDATTERYLYNAHKDLEVVMELLGRVTRIWRIRPKLNRIRSIPSILQLIKITQLSSPNPFLESDSVHL